MKKGALFISMIAFTVFLMASDAKSILDSATENYKIKNYAAAAAGYDSLLHLGFTNSALYFNLGNCNFKEGQYVQAILNFERANKLNPEDEDIQYNLKMARVYVVDKSEDDVQSLLHRWFTRLLNQQSRTGWIRWAIILLWITLLPAISFMFFQNSTIKKSLFILGACMLLGSGLFFWMARARNNFDKQHVEAVVMSSNIYVNSEPNDSGLKLFMLHGGAKVQVVDSNDGWTKIRFSAEKIGWLPSDAIEQI